MEDIGAFYKKLVQDQLVVQSMRDCIILYTSFPLCVISKHSDIQSVIIGAVSEVVSGSQYPSISSISLSTGSSPLLKHNSLFSFHLLLLSPSVSLGAVVCSISSIAWMLSPLSPVLRQLSLLVGASPCPLLPVTIWKNEKVPSEPVLSVTKTAVGPWLLKLSCGLLGGLVFVFLLSMKLKKAVTRSIVPEVRIIMSPLISMLHLCFLCFSMIGASAAEMLQQQETVMWSIELAGVVLPGMIACHTSTGCRKQTTDMME